MKIQELLVEEIFQGLVFSIDIDDTGGLYSTISELDEFDPSMIELFKTGERISPNDAADLFRNFISSNQEYSSNIESDKYQFAVKFNEFKKRLHGYSGKFYYKEGNMHGSSSAVLLFETQPNVLPFTQRAEHNGYVA